MIVLLDDGRLSYSGRIDRTNPLKLEFLFPASSLSFRFLGRKAVLFLENRRFYWDNYLGGMIDGKQMKWRLEPEGITRIVLLDADVDQEHQVMLFKRQDGCHIYALCELEICGELLEPEKKPARRIEVYGDSISAGEVSEATDYVGKPDPPHQGEYSNSWYSYAWIAARRLGAELHDIAQGGIPLLNGAGWYAPPWYPGMEFIWDKLRYQPEPGNERTWDFSRYRPQLVLLAIGQNDSNPEDYMALEPGGAKAKHWKEQYAALVKQLRTQYPEAVILLKTTILCHHENWALAIGEICKRLREEGDERVYHFRYMRNGRGTPGHARISEAEEMAEELIKYIEGLQIPGWQEKGEGYE